jgi:hypothetical protein
MKKTTLIITLFVIYFTTSCKKDKDKDEEKPEQVWGIYTGNFLTTGRRLLDQFSNLTEEQFLNCTNCGYNGKVRDFVSDCDYKETGLGGPKNFFWEVKPVGAASYSGAYNATEKEASCYLGVNGNLYRKK